MDNKEVTILLVEDDDVDAMTIERAFKKLRIGNTIVRACDGLEAFEILNDAGIASPFIILLDLQMPRMNGLEFLEALRKDPQHGSSIVFVLTTSKADEDMISSYKHNVAGYFLKNSAGDEFLDIVNVLDGYWKIVHFPPNG
jgi:CheY-like chemotaxis protein